MDRALASATWMYQLARQQERRRQKIPTVTALAGDEPACKAAWRAWLNQQGRRGVAVQVKDAEPAEAAARALVQRMITQPEVTQCVLAHLAQTAPAAFSRDLDLNALASELGHGNTAELELFLAGLVRAGASTSSVVLCRQVFAPGTQPRAWRELLVELAGLVPEPALPGLFLTPGPHGFAHAAAAAMNLACLATYLPLALVAGADAVRAYLARTPESRVKAAIREGLVDIPAPEVDRHAAGKIPDGTETSGKTPEGTRIAEKTLDSKNTELDAALARASSAMDQARARRSPIDHPDPDQAVIEDRARSEAERVLFLALEATPETAGLFVLNQRIDIDFGPAAMEVDLWCAGLGVAVEVDGYYHFRDPDAYRRDRRKDVLLQLHDYLVVRCLADDVLAALDRVVETICHAVAAQRDRRLLSEKSP